MLKKIYLNIYLNCPVKKKQHLRFNFAKKNVNHVQCYVAKKSKPIYSTRRKAKVAVIVAAFWDSIELPLISRHGSGLSLHDVSLQLSSLIQSFLSLIKYLIN